MSLLGTTIGDYKIQRKIGSGGMGVVYQGLHIRLEQLVAIKDLSPELASNLEMRQRFIREARIQAKLNHPNVVNVHNLLEHEGRLLLVMEFVEGETLDKRIQERGALPYKEAVDICRQVLDALAFMHARGVIHRDLKPGNIMLTKEGRVKVTDFGIAKATTEKGQTRAGVRLGTLWYMSPEQVKGKPVDARSDLYAMGVTLFQMVTGKLPFFGNSDFEIMKAHTEVAPPDPKKIKKDLPKPLSSIILRLLEKNPDKRFQSAGEVLQALNALKKGVETPGEEAGVKKHFPGRPGQKSLSLMRERKPPAWIWILIAALLVAVGGIILTYWYLSRRSSIIPVVKQPVVKKKVAASPESSGTMEKGMTKKAGSEENVGPILNEIEQEEKGPKTSKGTAEKSSPAQGEKSAGLDGQSVEGKSPVTQKKAEKKSAEGVGTLDLSPPAPNKTAPNAGEKKPIVRKRAEIHKKKYSPSLRHHAVRKKGAEKSPSSSGKRISSAERKPQAVKGKDKTGEGERITIDKQLGHFFKSLKQSLRDLEHNKGKRSKGRNPSPDENEGDESQEFSGAFPRN